MIATATSALDKARGKALCQSFVLPWPPSVNRYWRTVGKVLEGTKWVRRSRTLISERGRAYRDEAIIRLRQQRVRAYERRERVAVRIQAYPPDRRRRDLDNLPKAPLDVLVAAGILHDDEQIDDLRYVRRAASKSDPRIEVDIAPLLEADEMLELLDYLWGLARFGVDNEDALANIDTAAHALRTRLFAHRLSVDDPARLYLEREGSE